MSKTGYEHLWEHQVLFEAWELFQEGPMIEIAFYLFAWSELAPENKWTPRRM